MDILWAQAQEIETRIDAEYYRPEFTELFKRLKQGPPTKTLADLSVEWNRIYIGIAGFNDVDDNTNYTPYIRPTDIGDNGEIDYDKLPWCKKEWLNDYGKSGCAQPGDLIVEVKGNTKKVAVVSSAIPHNCIVSGSSYRLQLNENTDVHFVQLYLLSNTGQKLKKRLTSNTTISYIDPESFINYLIPQPGHDVQYAIGNKVRKAERLRELAVDNWHSAGRLFEEILEIQLSPDFFTDFSKENIRSRDYDCLSTEPAVFNTVINDEIGAQYYHPRRVHAQKVVKNWEKWNVWSFLAKRQSKKNISCNSSAKYLGLDSIDSVTGVINNDSSINDSATPGSYFAPLDILFSRLRPYLNKVSIWPKNIGNGFGSGEFFVYKVNQKEVDPFYLFFVLKSVLGLYQVIDVTSGSTHPRVDAQIVDSTLIPRLEKSSEQKIADHTRKTHQFWYEANQLIPQAKFDIEALIDGTLDEAKLLAQGKEIDQWLKDNPSPYSEREN